MTTLLASADLSVLFVSMPEALRRELELLEDMMRLIDDAVRGTRGAVIAGLEQEHKWRGRGWDAKSIRRKYDKWAAAGRDSRALVNWSKMPRRATKEAVLECYKWYCERNQRKSLPAWRAMITDLANGLELKFVGDWTRVYRQEQGDDAELPLRCPYSLERWPEGWAYPTLQAAARLTPYQNAASRIGSAAARDFALPVLTTRVGLKVGQMFQFDDKWHDAEVNFPGQSGSIRALEFACYDVFSARKVAYGIRPRTVDEFGKRDNLKELEMRFLVAHLVCNVGFHREGCMMQAEHGTAAIRGPFAERLKRLSGGRIDTERPGIVGAAVHAGMWPGAGGGNPCFKALTESLHGLDHNELAMLPGQVGMDRDHHPEQFAAMSDYNKELIKVMAVLPESKRRQLLSPIMPWHNYIQIVGEIYDRIEDRKWHNMEGWEEAGLVVCEFQMSSASNWFDVQSLQDMPAGDRLAIEAFLRAHPELVRTRKLSPREVWQRGRGELDRLSKFLTPDLLERDDGFDVPVQSDGTITFKDRYLGPGKHVYYGSVTTPAGYSQDLVPGRQYRVFVTPYHRDEIFVTDRNNGVVLGAAPLYDRASKADLDAVHALMGAQKHDIAVKNAEIATRHAGEAEARTAMMIHNAGIAPELAGKGFSLPPAPTADQSDTAEQRARAAAEVDVLKSFATE